MPNAYTVLSDVTTYTCPVPADMPALAVDVMVFPLLHSSLPVAGSSAYSTAFAPALPLASANTRPLTMIGVRGLTSGLRHRSETLFAAKAYAIFAPLPDVSSQRVPAASRHVEMPSPLKRTFA